ncbi:hypothetical protein KC19_VG233200 [Ceratodon purpureus]|uniref:Uncharacterized protein n=1 Tax=Ceratodon purpureus TaxID=3225 RepID=A0A8T0HTJ9_CERPU|nr:hypothetical protein KC19_VG233200 [Ceratodon purpureus]
MIQHHTHLSPRRALNPPISNGFIFTNRSEHDASPDSSPESVSGTIPRDNHDNFYRSREGIGREHGFSILAIMLHSAACSTPLEREVIWRFECKPVENKTR